MASLAIPEHAADPTAVAAAQQQIHAWFERVEAALSPYRAGSDLCRWRRAECELDDSPLLAEVVAACSALAARTQGGFHPYDRVGRFDPTGHVKGWAIERGAAILQDAGVHDACLGVGGDIQMTGRADAHPWRAAVVDPADDRRVVAVIEAPPTRLAVATSGDAQRGAHIWPAAVRRPGDARPRVALGSVTVVGPDLGLADAFATAVWARALHEPLETAWSWLPQTGYGALAVLTDGTLRATTAMGEHLIRAA